jgi:hypothetical protein
MITKLKLITHFHKKVSVTFNDYFFLLIIMIVLNFKKIKSKYIIKFENFFINLINILDLSIFKTFNENVIQNFT